MSENWTILVPVDPSFVPSEEQRQRSWHALVTYVPEAVARWETDEHPCFVDAGSNWSGVSCPHCGADLDEWWSNAMDAAHESDFEHLEVRVPCCSTTQSLNDLDYPWPVAFARSRLVVDGAPDIRSGVIANVERVLGQPLRIVLRHL
jgi:hypothetical protein